MKLARIMLMALALTASAPASAEINASMLLGTWAGTVQGEDGRPVFLLLDVYNVGTSEGIVTGTLWMKWGHLSRPLPLTFAVGREAIAVDNPFDDRHPSLLTKIGLLKGGFSGLWNEGCRDVAGRMCETSVPFRLRRID